MCQPQKCNARFQRLAIRLNHGLSRITRITRILRSPERLSRNRGILVSREQRSGTGTRTNKGGRSGTGTRTNKGGRSGTGTRTNKGGRSGTGTRTNKGHGDPNEHRTRGPERTSGTGTRTNIGHGDPNEQRGRSGTGTRTNKGGFDLGIEVLLISRVFRSAIAHRNNAILNFTRWTTGLSNLFRCLNWDL